MTFENIEWTREPKEDLIRPERIEITTSPHTDLWQSTYYHFRNDNAPVLQERDYLKRKTENPREIELLAEVDGTITGTAGIGGVGSAEKTSHRASFGIGIDKVWWGLGIGRALTEACIECAAAAGYSQLELEVVANNERALSLYKSVGFVEYGRNPNGFISRTIGRQAIVLMRLELNG